MSRPDVELFALHLLGQLEGEEARAVAARAASPTPEDRELLRDAAALVATLSHAAPHATPPASARERLLSAARAERSSSGAAPASSSGTPPESSSRAAPGPSRRSARLAAVFAGLLFLLLAGLQVLQVLRAPGGAAAEHLGVMADPTTPRWILREGGKPDGRPLAAVFFDVRADRLIVGAKALPDIGPDETFVLWALDRADAGRSPRNIAAFHRGPGGVDAVVVGAPTPDSLTALAISIETNPRAKSPTATKIIAAGGA